MTIKFLAAHQVGSEKFTAGQLVKDRAPESEMHFVRRGLAAFVSGDGELTDHEGKPVNETATAVVVNVSDNRDGETGRAGEVALPDGAPQRASSGPGEVVTTTSVTQGESHKSPRKK